MMQLEVLFAWFPYSIGLLWFYTRDYTDQQLVCVVWFRFFFLASIVVAFNAFFLYSVFFSYSIVISFFFCQKTAMGDRWYRWRERSFSLSLLQYFEISQSMYVVSKCPGSYQISPIHIVAERVSRFLGDIFLLLVCCIWFSNLLT